MSNKTLSTGTLSLRFMQNASRRQQLQEVELERAEVKDEGKWEVGRDVKEAWGILQVARTDNYIAQEQSYLPFLFSHKDEDATGSNTSKPLGRRIFDKSGHDVSTSQSQVQPQQVIETSDSEPVDGIEHEIEADSSNVLRSSPQTPKSEETKGRKLKIRAQPVPISSAFGKGPKGFNGFYRSSETGRGSFSGTKPKSAREAIFDSMTDVGGDLRSTKYTTADLEASQSERTASPLKGKQIQPRQQQQPTVTSTGFLKPIGVDEPAPRKAVSSSGLDEALGKQTSPGIINGARGKRGRDQHDPEGADKKKRKKKRPRLDEDPTKSQEQHSNPS